MQWCLAVLSSFFSLFFPTKLFSEQMRTDLLHYICTWGNLLFSNFCFFYLVMFLMNNVCRSPSFLISVKHGCLQQINRWVFGIWGRLGSIICQCVAVVLSIGSSLFKSVYETISRKNKTSSVCQCCKLACS